MTAVDRFAATFGAVRGNRAAHGLAACVPNGASSRHAAQLAERARGGDVEPALAALAEHWQLIGTRPLLTGLAREVAEACVTAAHRDYLSGGALANFFEHTAIATRQSRTLVSERAPERTVLHVWPEGERNLMPRRDELAGVGITAVCGQHLQMTDGFLPLVNRGFFAEPVQDDRYGVCAPCRSWADAHPDDVPEAFEAQNAHPLREPWRQRLIDRAIELSVADMPENARTARAADGFCFEAGEMPLQAALRDIAVELCLADDRRAHYTMLREEYLQRLKQARAVGYVSLSAVIEPARWAQLITPYLPTGPHLPELSVTHAYELGLCPGVLEAIEQRLGPL